MNYCLKSIRTATVFVGTMQRQCPLLATTLRWHIKPAPECAARHFSYQATVASFWQSLSQSTPVAYVQQGLVDVHDFSGLPWWATIMIATVGLRTIVTLPLAIYQNKIFSRLEKISLEMPELVKELKLETAYAIKKFNWSEKEARITYNRSLKKQWNKLIVRENCHPAKTMILLWGQIPLWIVQSVAIRNLVSMMPDPTAIGAQIAYTELTMGGFGWIPNLTDVDHSLIFPVTLGIINLAIIEIQLASRTKAPSKLQTVFTNLFRVLSVVMVPIAATVPSCLCLYWVTSSAYGLGQNLLLLSPRFRRAVGIPIVPSELSHPYQHVRQTLAAKLGRLGIGSSGASSSTKA
ncbi:cytochrome c oxidase assembly protein COX18, mitochondrial [Anopheles cruzii]|uniref:cytochrome c oxidase assembly protein COX18, mitochondrial n=1 Tax=Anopheles cruzii TaxID=68878 RepID=UPI0022EC3F31|nr:cytochrome c oxidase assembly protein COX18, mitochondrial [Anopheles cruzii]